MLKGLECLNLAKNFFHWAFSHFTPICRVFAYTVNPSLHKKHSEWFFFNKIFQLKIFLHFSETIENTFSYTPDKMFKILLINRVKCWLIYEVRICCVFGRFIGDNWISELLWSLWGNKKKVFLKPIKSHGVSKKLLNYTYTFFLYFRGW